MRLDVHQITEQIYLGSMIDAEEWEQLRAWGVTAVLSLQAENCDHFGGMEMFLRLPTVDGTPPEFDQIIMGVRFLETAVALGKKIYVHCLAGVGRSVVVVAAYLIRQGMTAGEALRYLRERRPVIGLNDEQLDALEEFEYFVRAGGMEKVN